ncbi:transposase [Kribbella sp. NPDC055110]
MIQIAVTVATGVNADGFREVLGRSASTAESGAGWDSFFEDMVAHGAASFWSPGAALLASEVWTL